MDVGPTWMCQRQHKNESSRTVDEDNALIFPFNLVQTILIRERVEFVPTVRAIGSFDSKKL